MGKKAARRNTRQRRETAWVPIGAGDGDIRSLMEELHGRYPWLEGVDDRAVRIEMASGGVQVSVRDDQLPADWDRTDGHLSD